MCCIMIHRKSRVKIQELKFIEIKQALAFVAYILLLFKNIKTLLL